MSEYKKGDKVVVEIEENHPGYSFIKCGNSVGHVLDNKEILYKLEDFQPEEEKIKMTVEEKEEFDELKPNENTFSYALRQIGISCPNLTNRLFKNKSVEDDNMRQIEFAKAWEKPSRIKVIHEDVRMVQVGDRNLWEHDGEYLLVNHCDINNEHYYFTKSEIEKISKLEQFKYIDLVGAWEDIK